MSRRVPATRLFVIALSALTTILALVASPFARGTASLAFHSSSASRESHRSSVASLKARSGELAPLHREPRLTTRSRAQSLREGGAPPVARFALASALPSIAPLTEVGALRPFTWIAWRAPSRARADLMVFLN